MPSTLTISTDGPGFTVFATGSDGLEHAASAHVMTAATSRCILSSPYLIRSGEYEPLPLSVRMISSSEGLPAARVTTIAFAALSNSTFFTPESPSRAFSAAAPPHQLSKP